MVPIPCWIKKLQENTFKRLWYILHKRQRSKNKPFSLGTRVVTFFTSVSVEEFARIWRICRSSCLSFSPWEFLPLLSPERHCIDCIEIRMNLSSQENTLFSWSPMKTPMSPCVQFSGPTGLFFSVQCKIFQRNFKRSDCNWASAVWS